MALTVDPELYAKLTGETDITPIAPAITDHAPEDPTEYERWLLHRADDIIRQGTVPRALYEHLGVTEDEVRKLCRESQSFADGWSSILARQPDSLRRALLSCWRRGLDEDAVLVELGLMPTDLDILMEDPDYTEVFAAAERLRRGFWSRTLAAMSTDPTCRSNATMLRDCIQRLGPKPAVKDDEMTLEQAEKILEGYRDELLRHWGVTGG
jgi:hypothetical protein